MTEGKKPTEDQMKEFLDEKMTKHPPAFEPVKWSSVGGGVTEKIMEVNCAMNHLFTLANLTEQQKCTFIAERLGAWIGNAAQSPEQITSTICAMVPQMLEAGREFYTARKTREVLDKLFGQALRHAEDTEPKGRPN